MIFVKNMDIFIRDCIEKIENKYLYMCQFNKFIFIKLAFYHNMCNYIIVDSQELENYCSERFHLYELTKREDYYNFFEQYKIEELCYMDKNALQIIVYSQCWSAVLHLHFQYEIPVLSTVIVFFVFV